MNIKEAKSILEIEGKSDQAEVKSKYKDLARKWHPDVNGSKEANEKMKEINKGSRPTIHLSRRIQLEKMLSSFWLLSSDRFSSNYVRYIPD